MFEEFAKIPRLSRDCVISEKIDGTNAQVYIAEIDGVCPSPLQLARTNNLSIYAGSRTRWITPEQDNYGFASWVKEHAEELIKGLGHGRHYGEWWGSGVNRGYGFSKGEKFFSLFNTKRWIDSRVKDREYKPDTRTQVPDCCSVVPVLYNGEFHSDMIDAAIADLQYQGSFAAPGFHNPEGIIIYHTAANVCFKKTLIGDESPKSKQ